MSKRRRPILWLLRKLPEKKQRALAKGFFHAAGYLSKVKTYQRYYTGDWGNEDEPLKFKLAGWHWVSCSWSMQLLNMSMQLDWYHWDHWACQHTGCDALPCGVCGGLSCDEEGVE